MATSPAIDAGHGAGHDGRADLRQMTLAALGVVYGDIGTSPLYTLREAFGHAGGLHLSEPAVLRRAVAGLLVADPRRHASSTSS